MSKAEDIRRYLGFRLGRIDVTGEEWRAFHAAAAAQGVRPSQLLGEVVRDYLKNQEIRQAAR